MSVEIEFNGQRVPIKTGETVLDGLERAGFAVPSSCRAGVCQFCMLKAVSGNVPASSQQGLKPNLKESGHFLACVCRPDQSFECQPAHTADFRGYAEIEEICPIGLGVVRVRFRKPEEFSFVPGQFVTFRREDGLSRSYSMASRSEGVPYFDIHIRRIKDGKMSGWFHDEARPRDTIWIEGPRGDCTYYPGMPEEPITLIGTGTGIAPLFAIAEDAIDKGHVGPITFYHGAVAQEYLYFTEEIKALTRIYDNMQYIRCVMQKPCSSEIAFGDLKQIAAAELTNVETRRIYLCGDPGLVRVLKKQFFLAGVSLSRLHADPFVIAFDK